MEPILIAESPTAYVVNKEHAITLWCLYVVYGCWDSFGYGSAKLLSDEKLTIQCNAMQCNTIQYNTSQYNSIQYNTIQYNTIQYNTIIFI